ncbi:ubiquinol oxidase subunit II [Herbaspirillum sp. GCM10030257]|uniref:ubiquinol oxidase subunit II n=1 Tax=Herbaspirillum sp. GCM10030257 TaxID=3273393 RepID=UPI00360A3EC4
MHLLSARRRLLPLLVVFLTGCNTVVMNPSGDIAAQQGHLIYVSTMLMLLIIVPVIALTFLFAWRYRKSNTAARYEPDWDHSTKLELVIWGAPLLIIIALGLLTWISTHLLDPYRPLHRLDANRPIPADTKPLLVQVVALDWKWLFIYPEQGIATVNELVTPVDVPIRFKITASTVMNSFYIPALAGQIYAMPGMETTLNAVINKPGEYEGFSANYSGAGFSHMRFKYHGVSNEDFGNWVQKTKADGGSLDRANYMTLEKPSEREPVRRYATVAGDLFDAIVNRCVAPGSVCMKDMMAADSKRIGSGKTEAQAQAQAKAQMQAGDHPKDAVASDAHHGAPISESSPAHTHIHKE